MLEGVGEVIEALLIIKGMNPGFTLSAKALGHSGNDLTVDEAIWHLRDGDQLGRKILDTLGDLQSVLLLGGAGANRRKKGLLSRQEMLEALDMIERTSPPQTVIVIPLGPKQS